MAEPLHYLARRLFTGTEWLSDHAVVVENSLISAIVPAAEATGSLAGTHPIMAPALLDIQIYGAHDKLLAVYPETDALQRSYDYCSKGGAAHFQPTVATNDYEVFYRAIDAVKAYWKDGGKGCIGLHIEGPWIHPSKRGAHLESFIHEPSVEQARALLEYGKGVITMITLAPEVCSPEVRELVRSYGVVLSAGHSNATYEQALYAFDQGIGAATHLFNAMSALQHRAPGMVGAIFNHPTVRSSIVPDGHHVDFAAIRIAKQMLGPRLFAITDAVTETTDGPYPHHFVGNKYTSLGTLSGSCLTMAACVHNLVHQVGIELGEALRMASLYPAQVMGLEHRLGKIAVGNPAFLVGMNEGLVVEQVVD